MIFTRIIRNYFFELGHVFCARTVKNFAKSEQFISKPGPRSIGNILIADKICDGKLLVFGNIFELRDKVIWDHSLSGFDELHGFPWLDDLAARGDKAAVEIVQKWVFSWIEKYGSGSGPGWTPKLTSRRLIRLIHHEETILTGLSKKDISTYFKSIYKHANFISKRFNKTDKLTMNFEAIVGVIYCGLYIDGFERFITVGTEHLS